MNQGLPQSVESDAAIAAFVQWLITQLGIVLPFIAFPGVGWILGFILTPILQNVVNILLTKLKVDLIGIVVNQEKDAYEAAVTQLQTVTANPAATAAQQAAAIAAFKASFGSLIHSSVIVANHRRGL